MDSEGHQKYFKKVCLANRLADTAEFLLKSDETVYYADRHVPLPKTPADPQVACAAGVALLEMWNEEIPRVRARGLFCSEPVLIIDQKWLDGSPHGPPPHVYVMLAKDAALMEVTSDHGERVDAMDTPIASLLDGRSEVFSARRIHPIPENEMEGAWLFRMIPGA